MTDYALRLSDEEVARYRMMAEKAKERELDLWRQAGMVPGAAVLDAGCGPGALLPSFAELVGPDGRVDAVDGDEPAVAAATAMVSGLANVTVRHSRLEDTGLEPGYDVVNVRHVLAHNGRTAQAIVQHLADLLRPGGALLLVDVDMTAMRLRPEEPAGVEMLARYTDFQVQRGGAVQVGLHLDELMQAAGLQVEAYLGFADVAQLPPGVRGPAWAARDAMVAAGVVSQDDVDRWGARFDALEAAGTLVTVFAPRYLAIGRRAG